MISLEKKKVIVFDLDGTIVKLAVDWDHLKKRLTERYNEVYRESCEFIHISACLDYVVNQNDETELQNFFKLIEEHEIKRIKDNKNIEETIFFLNNLRKFDVPKDTNIAVLSLNTRKTIIESLKLAGIYEKIGFIVGREDVRKWKPNPDGLFKIRDYYNVSEDDMIYIGDLEKDVTTGKNAGIDAYLIYDLINLVNKKKIT